MQDKIIILIQTWKGASYNKNKNKNKICNETKIQSLINIKNVFGLI